MYLIIKKICLGLIFANVLMYQTVKADILFYYMAGVLPSMIASQNPVDCETVNFQGVCTFYEYHDSGVVLSETPYINGVIDGVQRIYYESGVLSRETPFVDGVREGIQKGYYQSGELMVELPFVNDLVDGIRKIYYEGGVISLETTFVNGVREGTQRSYYQSGSVQMETPYVNDVIDGMETAYYEYGLISRTTPYVNGIKEGLESIYSDYGILNEIPYVNGLIEGIKKDYDFLSGDLTYAMLYIGGVYQRTLGLFEALFVGETRYFADSQGVIGYRVYGLDGNYTGSLTQADGTTIATSGTYTIIDDNSIADKRITLNSASPTPSTSVLTYIGEQENGLAFDISVDEGVTFQMHSFETEALRDDFFDDHGDDFATATVLPLNQISNGNIETPGDQDYFEITVPEDGLLAVSTNGTTDTYGYLYDASFNLITENDDDGEDTNFYIEHTVTAGTYYLRVEHFDATQTGEYNLATIYIIPLPLNQTRSDAIETPGKFDLFEMIVPVDGRLQVSTTGTTDTYGFLLDASFNEIAQDDDGGTDRNFYIDYNVTAGTYYVEVKHYDETQTGEYNITATFDDHGDNNLTATNLPLGQSLNGSIETEGDVDYFRVVVAQDGYLRFTTSSQYGSQSELYDASGNAIGFGSDDGAQGGQVITVNVIAGIYYLSVGPYNGSGHGIDYTVYVEVPVDDHGNDIATASDLPLDQTYGDGSEFGSIETEGDADYFRVVVPQDGLLRVTTTSQYGSQGELYDASGNAIGFGSDDGAQGGQIIEANVTAGTYYISVEAYNGSGFGIYYDVHVELF